MAIKNELNDPHNVLESWDINSVDPCGWRMVTCSSDGYVSVLWITITKNLRNGEHKSFDTSFFVNCGGIEQTSTSGIDFYGDSEILRPSSLYTSSQHQWAVSNTGFYISNPNGPQYVAMTDSQILGTLESELYKTTRISPSSLMYYGLGLKNGKYIVKLHFAEIVMDDSVLERSWERIFDVYIQSPLVVVCP